MVKGLCDDKAGIGLIRLVHLLLGQVACAGDGTVKGVGMSSSIARQIQFCLSPRRSIRRVGVNHGAYASKATVQF